MAKNMWDLKQKADDPKTLDLFIYGDVEAITIDWVNCTLKESENSANAFRNGDVSIASMNAGISSSLSGVILVFLAFGGSALTQGLI